MPFIDEINYQCQCGRIFPLSREATRCPCECHREQLEQAKAAELYCEVCDFATLDPATFEQHFQWATHQRAAAGSGGGP